MIDVILHPGRDRSVRRRHPWILSGSIARVEGAESPPAGPTELARVLSSGGEVLAFGDYSGASSLRVRLLTFGKEAPEPDLVSRRIAHAIQWRRRHPLLRDSDGIRLINAEGDGLPGLVVDQYKDTVVVKLTSAGMAGRREDVAEALRRETGAAAGFERSDGAAARRDQVEARSGPLWGDPGPGAVDIVERGRRYAVDFVSGQKTGFYLDQRDGRDLVEALAPGRRTLDLFSYSGGFAVAAARGGARSVTLVDSSVGALALAEKNLRDNDVRCATEIVRTDAFEYLSERGDRNSSAIPADPSRQGFELVVIDPPPLARHRRDVARASRAYKDLLLFALRRASPEALILTYACSHHVGPDLFRKIAFGASLDARRPAQLLRTLGAAADHPVSIDHPEGAYLTGLLLQV